MTELWWCAPLPALSFGSANGGVGVQCARGTVGIKVRGWRMKVLQERECWGGGRREMYDAGKMCVLCGGQYLAFPILPTTVVCRWSCRLMLIVLSTSW